MESGGCEESPAGDTPGGPLGSLLCMTETDSSQKYVFTV